MSVHKSQAQTGPISVDFSVACVSYNLFNQVACKYYDPYNDNKEYDNLSLQSLTRNYYKGLAEFINNNLFDCHEVKYYGESFYEVELFRNKFQKETFLYPFFCKSLEYYRPRLILPVKINQYAKQGKTRHNKRNKTIHI